MVRSWLRRWIAYRGSKTSLRVRLQPVCERLEARNLLSGGDPQDSITAGSVVLAGLVSPLVTIQAELSLTVEPLTLSENGTATLSGTFTDPGSEEPHTIVIGWGDGTPNTIFELAAGVFSFSDRTHTYLDDPASSAANDVYPIMVTVTDEQGTVVTGSTAVTVNNVPPSGLALNLSAETISEGSLVTLNGSFLDPGSKDTHLARVNWGDGSVDDLVSLNVGVLTLPNVTHQYRNNPATQPSNDYTITVTVVDDDQGAALPTQASRQVMVSNVPPSNLVLTPPAPINEGGNANLVGTFVDPGNDKHTLTIGWGDGSSEVVELPAGSTSFSVLHKYVDDPAASGQSSFPVSVTLADTDEPSVSISSSTTATVNNQSPTLGPITLSTTSLAEGGTLTLNGTYADAGASDTHELTVVWGDGKSETVAISKGSYVLSHVYADDDPSSTGSDPRSIQITVQDDDGDSEAINATVTLVNQAPAFGAIAVVSPISEGDVTTVTGDFTDAGLLDTFTLLLAWGDGTQDNVILPVGTRTFTRTHRFADDAPSSAATDDFTITLTLTDDDGGSASTSRPVRVTNAAPSLTDLRITPTIAATSEAVLTGTITDPGTSDTFSLRIEWGNGDVETVSLAANQRTISVPHRYPAPGANLPVRVTLTDDDGGSVSGQTSITITEPPLVATGSSLSAVVGNKLEGVLATFRDPGTSREPSHYLATINWGDMTPATTGVVARTSAGFGIQGQHTYTVAGTFTATITVQAGDGRTVQATTSVSVSPRPETPLPEEQFLRELYDDLLGRPADAGGVSFFFGALRQGATRANVAQTLVLSSEFRTTSILDLYERLLGSEPDAVSLQAGLEFLGAGGSIAQLEVQLLGGEAFFARHGGTNNGFLGTVYQELLGRPIDADGLQVWTAALGRGESRTEVVRQISASMEGRAREVQNLYQELLGRSADEGGLLFFVGALTTGRTVEQLSIDLSASNEYYRNAVGALHRQFVAVVYRDLLRREVDASGLGFWSGQLDGGALTRPQFISGSMAAPEYRALVVAELYQEVLGRTPDAAGQAFWASFLGQSGTAEQVRASLFASAEYFQQHGATNQGFLQAIYDDALGRGLDEGAAGFWTSALAGGATREVVAAAILGARESDVREVASYYEDLLHRAADAGGLEFFTGKRNEDVIGALLASDEYFKQS